MSTPGRLHVDSDGKLQGDIKIDHNDGYSWPCVNGAWGSGEIQGVVMHTMIGNLPGTISCFNDPSFEASAHFGIAQDGSVNQFGPIGAGWVAWQICDGNYSWYGIEHADNENPDNPLTDAQIAASAQIVECLSNFAGFPLQEANTIYEDGYGCHYMGGEAWGGHSCPEDEYGHGPRAGQRVQILALAKAIRAGKPEAPPKPPTAYAIPGNLHEAPGAKSCTLMWDAPVPTSGKYHFQVLDGGAAIIRDIHTSELLAHIGGLKPLDGGYSWRIATDAKAGGLKSSSWSARRAFKTHAL